MILLVTFIALFLGLNLLKEYLIVLIITSIIFLVFILVRFKKKVFLVALFSMAIGVGISQINITFNPENNTYQGIVIESHENYYLFYSSGERFYIYEKDNKKENGDILTIKGSTHESSSYKIESEFDFSKYLSQKGVKREINVKSETIDFSIFLRKKQIKENFLSHFDNNSKALLDSLLFNVKDYDSSVISNLNGLGLLYLFSISGIYLNLIIIGLERLLKLKFKETTARIFSLLILGFYFLFAINKISICRIFILSVIKIINNLALKKRFSYLTLIGFCGIIMLLFNRYLAYQSAFYLGFFIIIFVYFVRHIFHFKHKIINTFASSFLIFLFMMPMSLSLSHELHLFIFLYQLILIPINFLFISISLISFYTFPFANLINGYSNFISIMINCFINYDFALYSKVFSPYISLIYYGVFFFLIYMMEIKYKFYAIISSISLFFVVIAQVIPFEYLYKESIAFINIGQGDSALISSGSYHYLIDTGGNLYDDLAVNSLIPYFKENHIYKIDGVFLSHYDYDHSGALKSLQKNFNVESVYDFASSYPVKCHNFTINNLNTNSHNNDNDNSTVLLFNFANKKWLFTGDISSNVEKELLRNYPRLDIDMLKVSHHGSDTATSEAFIKQITPQEAIISVGKNNYGHPSQKIIAILEKYKVKIRRTDLEGTISYNYYNFNI